MTVKAGLIVPGTQRSYYLCERCGFKSAHKERLRQHLVLHKAALVRCTECPEAMFSTQAQQIQHIYAVHRNRPFWCQQCCVGFKLRAQLRQHLSVHTDFEQEKTVIKCPKCPATFPNEWRKNGRKTDNSGQRALYIYHHTTERPYSCEYCNSKHTDRANYNAHVRRKHADKLQCTECDYKASTTLRLSEHVANCHDEDVVVQE